MKVCIKTYKSENSTIHEVGRRDIQFVTYTYSTAIHCCFLSPSVLISGSCFVLWDHTVIGLKEDERTNFTTFRPMEEISGIKKTWRTQDQSQVCLFFFFPNWLLGFLCPDFSLPFLILQWMLPVNWLTFKVSYNMLCSPLPREDAHSWTFSLHYPHWFPSSWLVLKQLYHWQDGMSLSFQKGISRTVPSQLIFKTNLSTKIQSFVVVWLWKKPAVR